MDDDRMEGAARNLGGKVESAVGDLVGDHKTKVDGLVDQVTGSAQNAYGSVKDAAKSISDSAPRYIDDAIDSSQRYYRQGSQAVREQFGNVPLTEILLAGAAGYFLAWASSTVAIDPETGPHRRGAPPADAAGVPLAFLRIGKGHP